MKRDGDEPAGGFLSGDGEGFLALSLAEIKLRRGGDGDLDDAVGELAWGELIEPDAMEAGMLCPDALEDLLPEGGIENGLLRATKRRLARRRRVGRGHGFLLAKLCFLNVCHSSGSPAQPKATR